ncbi:hypothetical protein [Phaeobacter sp.]|uniref:hypothetical protein n=1 Tax=Phaeobacter sp. TaxID=1902409 RepID=UPI0025F5CB2F|nr:hypothetical protein [Phaeobacter sp.]
MQRFKSWDEIEKTIEGGPTKAERKLIERLRSAEDLVSNTERDLSTDVTWSEVIAGKYDDRHIRATALKAILLNFRYDPSDLQTLRIESCFISGPLDLSHQIDLPSFHVRNCVFEKGFSAERSTWHRSLSMIDCRFPFLNAEALDIKGSLNLARSRFTTTDQPALNLQRGKVGESVKLNRVVCANTAKLNGLKVGFQLNCRKASFCGTVNPALNLQNARIMGGLVFRDLRKVEGRVVLAGAYARALADDTTSWPEIVVLNGFTYDRISKGSKDAQTRLEWLSGGDSWNGEFLPQPYRQLAKVLDDMGHEADAREVLYVLEKKLGAERRKALCQEIETLRDTSPVLGRRIVKYLLLGADHAIDWLQRVTVGYGRKPFRSIGVLAGLILTFWMLTLAAWHTGGFAPNSSIVLTSPDWATYDTRSIRPTPRNPADHWSETTIPGRDWESFSAIAYAADVVIPIIDFGQTDAWAPSTTRGPAGVILWWARWIFTLFGWIVTALGAAALTGIIRRE